MSVRRIVHVDMDAFFASVEQRDDPSLRGRPVVVGGPPDGRGVVAAASYEARRFGIRSAMPSREAHRRCPDAVFVRPDMARYRQASADVFAVFAEVTDLVEPLSVDEAFLDVTRNHLGLVHGVEVARWLRAEIRARTGLTASAGVAPVKFVAKIASDQHKPDGLTVVPPERVVAFLRPLDIGRLWGVGPKTAARLHALGLRTIGDVADADPASLSRALGDLGRHLHRLALGDDPRPVRPSRVRRSRGAETTFAQDVRDLGALRAALAPLAERVARGLVASGQAARTVTLKVRYADFRTVTRARTLDVPTDRVGDLLAACDALLARTEAGQVPVRLVGVSASGLDDDAARQLALFPAASHKA